MVTHAARSTFELTSPRTGWLLLLLIVVFTIMWQGQYLVCACMMGQVKLNMALTIKAGIALRALVGVIRPQHTSLAPAYAVVVLSLPFIIPMLID